MQLLNGLQKIIPVTFVLPTIGARVFALLIMDIYIYIYIYIYVSETPGKFLNVVLEKDGDDQLDRSCDK